MNTEEKTAYEGNIRRGEELRTKVARAVWDLGDGDSRCVVSLWNLLGELDIPVPREIFEVLNAVDELAQDGTIEMLGDIQPPDSASIEFCWAADTGPGIDSGTPPAA